MSIYSVAQGSDTRTAVDSPLSPVEPAGGTRVLVPTTGVFDWTTGALIGSAVEPLGPGATLAGSKLVSQSQGALRVQAF